MKVHIVLHPTGCICGVTPEVKKLFVLTVAIFCKSVPQLKVKS